MVLVRGLCDVLPPAGLAHAGPEDAGAASFGVRQIADAAKAARTFLGRPTTVAQRKRIHPGALFLEEGGRTGYLHTGMVVNVAGSVFHTIEGNSNPGGSNNGFEVIARTRAFGPAYDFALV